MKCRNAANKTKLLRMKSKSESGQALLEYVLLLSIGAMVSLGFATFFKGFTNQGVVGFNGVLERELRTSNVANVTGVFEN